MNRVDIRVDKLDYRTSEAYKALRTNLRFCGDDKRVIALTSCFANEGKSSVALNLAVALAEDGERVVLVDADLRNSVLLGRSALKQETMGLTHYLSRQCSLAETVCMTNINQLHVIFSGPIPPNPAELLGRKEFSLMIEALRKVYTYVIVDTPPLGLVIDPAIIAEQCDGVALVLESGADSYRVVRDIKDQLDKTNCTVLGVILNKIDETKDGYGRYGKYGHYGEIKKEQ
jgi:capsular exopolysaccharide synthesis family protein